MNHWVDSAEDDAATCYKFYILLEIKIFPYLVPQIRYN
jgi:hypothetical protein